MEGDSDDAFTKALRSRYNDLEAQRADLAAKLAALDESAKAEPDKPSIVQVHDEGEHATITITLPADQASEVAGAAERIGDQMNPQGMPEGRAGGVLERAPGEIPAAITPIVLPDGLLFRVDVRLMMERRAQGGVRGAR